VTVCEDRLRHCLLLGGSGGLDRVQFECREAMRAVNRSCDCVEPLVAMALCGRFFAKFNRIRSSPWLCIGRPAGRVCTVAWEVQFALDTLL
jgi:hypothetical protein